MEKEAKETLLDRTKRSLYDKAGRECPLPPSPMCLFIIIGHHPPAPLPSPFFSPTLQTNITYDRYLPVKYPLYYYALYPDV